MDRTEFDYPIFWTLGAHVILEEIRGRDNRAHFALSLRVPILLHEEALLFFPRRFDPALHDRWLTLFGAHHAEPVLAQEARSLQSEFGLVQAGVGCCLVTESVTRQGIDGISYRPFVTGEAPTVRLFAAWRPDSPHAARERFVEILGPMT